MMRTSVLFSRTSAGPRLRLSRLIFGDLAEGVLGVAIARAFERFVEPALYVKQQTSL
jgi:hypothetical protein